MSVVPITMDTMANESSVAVVWMTPDSELRMRDIEGICNSVSPLKKKLSQQEIIRRNL